MNLRNHGFPLRPRVKMFDIMPLLFLIGVLLDSVTQKYLEYSVAKMLVGGVLIQIGTCG